MGSYKTKPTGSIMYYYETDGSKQSIVFLHGLGDNGQMWWNQLKPFSWDFRYFTPDMRGMGKTDKTKGDYTIELLGKDMSEFWQYARMQVGADCETADELKALKLPAVWVGYSLGGRVALQVAATHPEDVKCLILVSSGIGLNKPTPEAIKRRADMIALLQKNDMKKWAEMATDAAFSPGFKQKNPKAYEQYMKVKLQQKNDAVLSYMNGMANAPAPDLTRVKMPVLFVVGQNDQGFGPEQAKQAQAALPNSKVVVLPTGHASPIEAPEQFNKTVLDFIASVK
jgi:3-oxoadipate enol-lactonase